MADLGKLVLAGIEYHDDNGRVDLRASSHFNSY